MGGTARQFNKFYSDYKKRFKKPIENTALLMPYEFTDSFFVDKFKHIYPHLWEDLEKQYNYWHKKNDYLIKHGKKSRYNFRKPYNFILDCSFYPRKKLRKSNNRIVLTAEERERIETEILDKSKKKLQKQQERLRKQLYFMQEIEPAYTKEFINQYFKSYDLHERLEIIRELSKYKSDRIIAFFYKVNVCTRNMSLKEESMQYIQRLGLPFFLRRKKKGKTNYIDNEIVKNISGPDVLRQRLYVDRLEKLKVFDVFISHNSKDEDNIICFFKELNKEGFVAYIDWVNDKYDLKRQWCNASTAQIIKERIRQSHVFILYLSERTMDSQWCPWELGYADALGKKIAVYYHNDDIEYIPQFYLSYPRLVLGSTKLIQTTEGDYQFEEWIRK